MTKRLDTRLKVIAQQLGMKRSPVFAVAWFLHEKMDLQGIALELECSAETLRPVYDRVKEAFEAERSVQQDTRQSRAPKRGKPHKIPAGWRPSDADITYAKEKGFDDSQIKEIIHNFVGYFTEAGIERNGWSLTWQRWIRAQAEREATRRQDQAPPAPKETPREVFAQALKAYEAEGSWPAMLGPPPGSAGCRVPADMLR